MRKRMKLLPHALILSTYSGEPYDGEDAKYWDNAELRCPYDPPSELMPCAVWDRCGCKPKPSQVVRGRCPHSSTGWHWIDDEGEPNRPRAECWPTHHAEGLDDAAFELDLPPGTYLVRTFYEEGCIRLEPWKARR